MINYILRRVLIGFVTLLLITFIVYGLIRNIPGTPLTLNMSEGDPSKKFSPAELERMNASYGLNQPWPIGYVKWLGNIARLDLGRSKQKRTGVSNLIAAHIGPTLLLSVPSLIITYVLSVPLGLYSTVRSGKPDERTMSTLLYMLYSVPTFVTGLLLLSFFAVYLEGTWLEMPLGNWRSRDFQTYSLLGKVADIAWHLALPLFCYTYVALAYYSRFVKSTMEEVIRQDYIRTARAKGVSFWKVIFVHAFRNTMIPFVTMLGLTLPGLIGGAIILEQVFSWRGMGSLFIEALSLRDYEVIMGLTLIFSVMTLFGQLVADITYAFVDPRIVYS